VKKIVVAIPHAINWFWLQTCIACLKRFPPKARGFESTLVVVDNSWSWSPSIRGITEASLGDGVEVFNNPKLNPFHATALDAVIEKYDFDYLMALESDVCVLRPDWLQWFVDCLTRHEGWFCAGHMHHEHFINPSCTLYKGDVLRRMNEWCKANKSLLMRWGEGFRETATEKFLPFPGYRTEEEMYSWMAAPFAERRGWPEGTVLREPPSGQLKGPGWYEPGQALYHWARENGDLGYLAVPTQTAWRRPSWPYQTVYGDHHELPDRELELRELFDSGFYTCHFWLGAGALTVLKHPVAGLIHEEFMHYGLPREGRFWKQVVPPDIQEQTIALIKKHGWGTKQPLEVHRGVESIYREKAGIPL
jgi:hypothetical protein